MTPMQQLVYSNLDSALENDYDVRDWTAEDIVADLLAFASDCEELGAAALLPHVRAWLAEPRVQAWPVIPLRC